MLSWLVVEQFDSINEFDVYEPCGQSNNLSYT